MRTSFLAICALLWSAPLFGADQPKHPNILWVSSEDHGPHMGCYGDKYATTPNVDKLAAKGMIYLHCLVQCPGLCPGAHHDHLRHVSAFNRRRTHAEHGALSDRT